MRARVATAGALLATIAVLAGTLVAEAVQTAPAPGRQSVSLTTPKATEVGQRVRVKARFRPARPGRVARLQVKAKGRWVNAGKATQDAKGAVTFRLKAERTGRTVLRVKAPAAKGLPAVTSGTRRVRIRPERVVIDESFHALTETEAASASYDAASGRLAFPKVTRGLKRLAKGDHVVLSATSELPSGALLRLRSVRQVGRRLVAKAAPASITDVVRSTPDGSDFAMEAVGQPTILWTAPGTQVTTVSQPELPGNPRLKVFKGPKLAVGLNQSIDLGDGAKVTTEGVVTLTPLVEVDMDIDWFGDLQSYKVGAGAEIGGEVAVGVKGSSDLISIPITKYSAVYRGMIGAVPIWVSSTTEAAFKGTISGGFELSTSSSGTAIIGVAGDVDGGGLAPAAYHDFPDWDFSPETGFEVASKVSLGPEVSSELNVYSVAGPYLKAGLTGSLSAQTVGLQVECELAVGAEVEVGVGTSEFFEKVVGKDYTLASATWPFELSRTAEWCDTVPTPTSTPTPTGTPTTTPTETPTEDPDALRVTTSELSTGFVGDPYGALLEATSADGTWSLASGALPAGLTLSEAGVIEGTPTGPPGRNTFVVRVSEGDETATKSLEILVEPPASWKQVSIADGLSYIPCGLTTEGRVSCWWFQTFFNPERGDGSNSNYARIATVPGRFVDLEGSCGLRVDGTAACWTTSSFGWINEGFRVVELGHGWVDVTGDGAGVCGVRVDGTARCWDIADDPLSEPPGDLPGAWVDVSLEDGMVCGQRPDGSGVCWPFTVHHGATEVVTERWYDTREGSCGVLNSEKGWCPRGEIYMDIPGDWKAVSSDECSIAASGDLKCRSWDHEGEVAWDRVYPGEWVSVRGNCGVKADQTGWCWGPNGAGQVGDGTRTDAYDPVQLPGLWKSIVQAWDLSCGIQVDDSAWCWGDSPEQTYDWRPPTRLVPTRVQSGP